MKKLFLMIMAAVALMTGCTSKESKQTEKEQTTMKTAKDTFALSAEERAQNMQEVHDYVRECGYYTIATVDGDQPRVSYQPGDGNMAMLYITNATARFCSFTGKPERSINF